jgi:uncharacterized membrane protein
MTDRDETAPKTPVRIAELDIARGIALIAMLVYHFAWDLSFLGLIETNIRDIPAWTWFARGIAASFLTLTGISLVLAHQEGWNGPVLFRRRAFFRRLVWIVGAALLVTAGTYIVLPRSFVFFGILHAIAVGSVLALPFLHAPRLVTAIFAAFVLVLPEVTRFEAFSAPWLVWLGLGAAEPITNDFVPVFPWFAFVLIGVLLGKSADFARFSGLVRTSSPAHVLVLAGRNSLLVYLLHQPILFGCLSLIALASAPPVDREAHGFMTSCQQQCQSVGGDSALCTRVCTCTLGMLKAEGAWSAVLAGRLDEPLKEQMGGISQRCTEAARSTRP